MEATEVTSKTISLSAAATILSIGVWEDTQPAEGNEGRVIVKRAFFGPDDLHFVYSTFEDGATHGFGYAKTATITGNKPERTMTITNDEGGSLVFMEINV